MSTTNPPTTNGSSTPIKKNAPPFHLHFLAGGIAGTVGAAILCPLEVAKTRLQVFPSIQDCEVIRDSFSFDMIYSHRCINQPHKKHIRFSLGIQPESFGIMSVVLYRC